MWSEDRLALIHTSVGTRTTISWRQTLASYGFLQVSSGFGFAAEAPPARVTADAKLIMPGRRATAEPGP
ncbi:hypothetical protein C7T35_40035 [Variovorax sp. WS11]|nr:hypothetical protein C7T35_40035 [Variovorax sp. WS11]